MNNNNCGWFGAQKWKKKYTKQTRKTYGWLRFVKSQYNSGNTMCSELDLGLKHQEMRAVMKAPYTGWTLTLRERREKCFEFSSVWKMKTKLSWGDGVSLHGSLGVWKWKMYVLILAGGHLEEGIFRHRPEPQHHKARNQTNQQRREKKEILWVYLRKIGQDGGVSEEKGGKRVENNWHYRIIRLI